MVQLKVQKKTEEESYFIGTQLDFSQDLYNNVSSNAMKFLTLEKFSFLGLNNGCFTLGHSPTLNFEKNGKKNRISPKRRKGVVKTFTIMYYWIGQNFARWQNFFNKLHNSRYTWWAWFDIGSMSNSEKKEKKTESSSNLARVVSSKHSESE